MATDSSDGTPEIRIEEEVVYVEREDGPLTGTLYRPASAAAPLPALVAVHGGGWQRASTSYLHLGPWLARRGYVVFAPRYRLTTPDQARFPDAAQDVAAALQFVRGRAGEFGVDPNRLALMGDSAGGHLAALVALAGTEPFLRQPPGAGEFADLSTEVKLLVSVYGVYDLAQAWQHAQMNRPSQSSVERLLGASLADDRRLYFDASPLSYVSRRGRRPDVLLAWGTEDDIVDPAGQALPFLQALKQADIYVRTVVVPGAPHYWLSDPLDEPGSYSLFFALRLLRFLQTRL